MLVVERASGRVFEARIEPLSSQEFTKLSRSRYFFDWDKEKRNEVFKIRIFDQEDILGLMSLMIQDDKRIEINLLAVSRENMGKDKVYEGIAGNMIAWACREAVKRFGEEACVSLTPKTRLVMHYKEAYGMVEAGRSLFLSGEPLLRILEMYNI